MPFTVTIAAATGPRPAAPAHPVDGVSLIRVPDVVKRAPARSVRAASRCRTRLRCTHTSRMLGRTHLGAGTLRDRGRSRRAGRAVRARARARRSFRAGVRGAKSARGARGAAEASRRACALVRACAPVRCRSASGGRDAALPCARSPADRGTSEPGLGDREALSEQRVHAPHHFRRQRRLGDEIGAPCDPRPLTILRTEERRVHEHRDVA